MLIVFACSRGESDFVCCYWLFERRWVYHFPTLAPSTLAHLQLPLTLPSAWCLVFRKRTNNLYHWYEDCVQPCSGDMFVYLRNAYLVEEVLLSQKNPRKTYPRIVSFKTCGQKYWSFLISNLWFMMNQFTGHLWWPKLLNIFRHKCSDSCTFWFAIPRWYPNVHKGIFAHGQFQGWYITHFQFLFNPCLFLDLLSLF